MSSGRNAPCACGSGKKFKHCCAMDRPRSSHRVAGIVMMLFVAAAAWAVYGVSKRVLEESADAAEGEVIAQRPPGPAPPGKEWSYEHGHWHNLPGFAPQPEGPVPPGKVWSFEHGHWHDIDGSEPADYDPVDFEPAPAENVSYSE